MLPQFRGKFVLISHAESTCRPDSSLKAFATAETFSQFRTNGPRRATRGMRETANRGCEA